MNNPTNLRLEKIQRICVLYIMAWSISPPMSLDTIYRVVALGCGVVWIWIALSFKPEIPRFIFACLCFMVAVGLIAYIRNPSASAIMKQIAVYMLVLAVFMNHYYKEKWSSLEGLQIIIILLLILWNARTIQALFTDSHVMRFIVRDDADFYPYLRKGVGGYGLLYPQVCIFPMALSWTIAAWKKNKVKFAIGALWVVTYAVMVFKAEYSIAIATTILGMFALIYARHTSVLPSLLLTLLLFFGALYLMVYSTTLQNTLLTIFDETVVEKKIQDLIVSAANQSAYGSIGARVESYQFAFHVMLKYPIIGGLWWSPGSGHSAILDSFAQYGIIGGYIYTKMVCFYPISQKKLGLSRNALQRINSVMITTLLVGVLDSFNYQIMFMVLLMVPLLNEDIKYWKREAI